MCIIIDSDCAHQLNLRKEDAKPIIEWVEKRHGKIATGGKNAAELIKAGLGQLLAEYRRSGRLHEYTSERILAQQKQIDNKLLRSNDLHIVCLARISGCRLVFTRDNNLKHDLRNLSLVPRRNSLRTQFYQGVADRRKLGNCPDCHD